MFKNLFKKNKAVIVIEDTNSAKEILTSIKSYPKEVIEIHNEFETAADKLVVDANNIIKEAESKDINKVSRLQRLGFKQSTQVVELKPLLEAANLSKEQLNMLRYFNMKYPNNKFITESQVEVICKKYNLVCGDVDRFKGFVPEKNLKDIESFKLLEEDMVVSGICWGKSSKTVPFTISYKEFLSAKLILRGEEKDVDIRQNVADKRWFNSRDLSRCLGRIIPGEYFDRVYQKSLKICAPVKDMDISGLELTEGYKLKKKFIPDPVVLQPVNEGYLIITAWGDEASDPVVVNNKFN